MSSLLESSAVWARAVRAVIPTPWPRDYIVLDTETSGLDPHADLVLQYGCVVVRGNVVVHASRAYLNWVSPGRITEDQLRNKMAGVAAKMAEKGACYRLDCDTVLREGQDPLVFISALADTIRMALDNGLAIVGHNLCTFDLVLLSRAITDLTGRPLLIPTNKVFDTGMLEKGRQLNNVPSAFEDQVQWFTRIANTRSKVKWKLDGWCADLYDLWGKSGLDVTAAHDAMSDCILTHHLYQSLKELIENA